MTIKEAKATARASGFSLSKTEWGEFRVNVAGGPEATAYYAGDLQEALDTMRHMASEKFQDDFFAALGEDDPIAGAGGATS